METLAEQAQEVALDLEVLRNTLIEEKKQELNPEAEKPAEIDEIIEVQEKKSPKPEKDKEKRSRFTKADQNWDLDDDAEIEIKADKGSTRLTLKELKERAAGDIAVKKRMHQLAEEKKKVQSTLSDFARLGKEDPLAALEYMVAKAQEEDEDFDFNSFLTALGDQAEKLDGMTSAERENYRLKKQLKDVESEKDSSNRLLHAGALANEIMENYNLSGDQLNEFVEQVVNTPELMEGAETEEDIFDRVEMLAEETQNQKLAFSALQELVPDAAHDDPIVFAMADVLRNNPELADDFDPEDMKEIVQGLLKEEKRNRTQQRSSYKMRQTYSADEISGKGMSDIDILSQKLRQEKEEEKKQLIRW